MGVYSGSIINGKDNGNYCRIIGYRGYIGIMELFDEPPERRTPWRGYLALGHSLKRQGTVE